MKSKNITKLNHLRVYRDFKFLEGKTVEKLVKSFFNHRGYSYVFKLKNRKSLYVKIPLIAWDGHMIDDNNRFLRVGGAENPFLGFTLDRVIVLNESDLKEIRNLEDKGVLPKGTVSKVERGLDRVNLEKQRRRVEVVRKTFVAEKKRLAELGQDTLIED